MEQQKFVIVSREFGYPIYMSLCDAQISDQRKDATEFVYGEDNPEIKAKFMTACAGYKFTAEPV